MQPPEEFMKSLFRARTGEVRRELEARASFRKEFFADECAWDSRSREIERSESEEIVEIVVKISDSDTTMAEVITREIYPFPRLRYILEAKGDTWLIQRVDVEFEKGKWSIHGHRP